MKITYIFHVIGTLTMQHVERALQSLREQDSFHWNRFVLYNGSDLSTTTILEHVPREFFDKVEVFTYNPATSKSCSADWLVQMQEIGGADRYLCHKADFYLPPWICREFEAIKKQRFMLLFNKYDMKSRATLEDIQRYARLPWREGLEQPDCGMYQKHLGFIAIPFVQIKGGADGVMHGYTDDVRQLWKPSWQEVLKRWGVAVSFRVLERDRPRLMLRSKRFFACHMWHESPDRTDWNKNMSPEERF